MRSFPLAVVTVRVAAGAVVGVVLAVVVVVVVVVVEVVVVAVPKPARASEMAVPRSAAVTRLRYESLLMHTHYSGRLPPQQSPTQLSSVCTRDWFCQRTGVSILWLSKCICVCVLVCVCTTVTRSWSTWPLRKVATIWARCYGISAAAATAVRTTTTTTTSPVCARTHCPESVARAAHVKCHWFDWTMVALS